MGADLWWRKGAVGSPVDVVGTSAPATTSACALLVTLFEFARASDVGAS
jgi:hypothetical protein